MPPPPLSLLVRCIHINITDPKELRQFCYQRTPNKQMMKFLIALTLLVASVAAAPVDRDALEKDFFDFVALHPMEEMLDVVMAYHIHDAEFQNLENYILSEEYKNLLHTLQRTPQTLAVINFVHDAGMKIYDYINIVNEALGIDRLEPPMKMAFDDVKITGTLQGLVDDLTNLMPYKEIDELHQHKLKTSPHYAHFIERVSSKEFENLNVEVYFSPAFINMVHSMQKADIDVSAVRKLFCLTIGINKC